MLKMFIFWKAVGWVEIKCLFQKPLKCQQRTWTTFTGPLCQYHSKGNALIPRWVLPGWLSSKALWMLGTVKLQQDRFGVLQRSKASAPCWEVTRQCRQSPSLRLHFGNVKITRGPWAASAWSRLDAVVLTGKHISSCPQHLVEWDLTQLPPVKREWTVHVLLLHRGF